MFLELRLSAFVIIAQKSGVFTQMKYCKCMIKKLKMNPHLLKQDQENQRRPEDQKTREGTLTFTNIPDII